MAFGSASFGIADAPCPLVKAIRTVLATTGTAIAAFAVVLFCEDQESFWRQVSVAFFNGDFP
jgi:hypothetical protein